MERLADTDQLRPGFPQSALSGSTSYPISHTLYPARPNLRVTLIPVRSGAGELILLPCTAAVEQPPGQTLCPFQRMVLRPTALFDVGEGNLGRIQDRFQRRDDELFEGVEIAHSHGD